MCANHGGSMTFAENVQALFPQRVRGATPETQAAPAPTRRRLKLWELEGKFHCPVIGTCLDLNDLRKVARQAGFSGHDIDPYRLHVEAVALSSTRNIASETLQKLLERRHAVTIRAFDAADTIEAVMALWRQYLDQGELASAFWATVTHRCMDGASRNHIYGEVHMLTHQLGAELAATRRTLHALKAETLRLNAQMKEMSLRHSRSIADKSARIHQLERENLRVQQIDLENARLRARLDVLESPLAQAEWEKRLAEAEHVARLARDKATDLQAQLSHRENEIASLRRACEESRQAAAALEHLCTPDTMVDAPRECGAECQQPELDRCLLCVGGRVPLLPQYRQMAARMGWRFIHHDGGQEESMSRLPELLHAADAVICPTDCVSHSAYYQLKRHCKMTNKPCLMARSSGLASVAAALQQVSSTWESANTPC